MQRRTFLQTGFLGFLSTGMPAMAAPTLRAPRRADGPIRLSSNENPLGMAPAAQQAVLDHLGEASRYPSAAGALVEALSKKLGVAPAQIVLGAGSSEVLHLAVQASVRSNATFIIAEPTFEDVPGHADTWGLQRVRVPLRQDGAHDIARMRAAAEAASGTAVVYICNPNNPTGTLTPGKELDDWIGAASSKTIFLVDEAYFEFAEGTPGFASMLPRIGKHDNVIVTRTFSKIFGMAGMRLGYGLAHADTAERLRRLGGSTLSTLALRAGLASLQDTSHIAATLQSNQQSKKILLSVLAELGLPAMPSCANFVMHGIKGQVGDYIARMRDAGFQVGRPFPPLLDHNRVSLGTPAEMEKFAATLRDFRQRGWV
jgi:histidinol-phosphate aminotransferase